MLSVVWGRGSRGGSAGSGKSRVHSSTDFHPEVPRITFYQKDTDYVCRHMKSWATGKISITHSPYLHLKNSIFKESKFENKIESLAVVKLCPWKSSTQTPNMHLRQALVFARTHANEQMPL